MPETTDHEVLKQAVETLRRALADAREEQRLADELLASMRDRLKSTIIGTTATKPPAD